MTDFSLCDHKFLYGGVKYKVQQAPRGGTQYAYFDWFYCEKCLKEKLISLDSTSAAGYAAPLFNAIPARKEKR